MMERDGALGLDSLRAKVENEHRFKSVYRGYDKKSVNEYISSLEKEKDSIIEELKETVENAERRSDEMKAHYLKWQKEVKIVREQKKTALESLKAEYEEKIAQALEENTKTVEASNEENNTRLTSIIEEKSQQIQDLQEQFEKQLEEMAADKEQEKEAAVADKSQEMQEIIEQKDREIEILNNKLLNREEAEKQLEESAIEGYKAENAKLTEENNKKKVIIAELEEKLSHISGNLENNVKMLDSLNVKLGEMMAAKFAECEDIVSVWSEQYDSVSTMIKNRLRDEV